MTTKITEKNISNIANAAVQWQSVVVADGSTGLTMVAGRGYFINTTSGTITVTLPATATIGDTIVIKDYTGTFASNNVTLGLNGHKIDGQSFATAFSTNNSTIELIYVDQTEGWRSIENVSVTDIGLAPTYVAATGGTVTTSGDFKIHSFTGDGCFVVSTAGNVAGSNTVSYLVVAGGGGTYSGGGGAGGFREGKATSDCYSASPLNAPGGLPVSATTYPITVGAGGSPGSGHPGSGIPFPAPSYTGATSGSNSVFSTVTSTGGGRGGSQYNQPTSSAVSGATGGSGGGGGTGTCGPTGTPGNGNTPPVSPSQGNNGGSGGNVKSAGGGGGATSAGTPGGCSGAPTQAGGGSGATTSISGSPTTYAGGGGGGSRGPTPVSPGFVGVTAGTGGSGGGGNGGASPSGNGTSGSANTGGGAGGAGSLDAHFGSAHSPGAFAAGSGGAGGKGVVIIRYKFQ